MPAPIPDEARNRIVFYSALGYSQREIAEAVGVSRNTVRKYREEARTIVEAADEPGATLAEIVSGSYDWERPTPASIQGFGDLPQ